VADNKTDNSAAFRAAARSNCNEILVPIGVWKTGPFNLSSNTVLRVEGTISGSEDPAVYPAVTQQPVDEAYRAPWMKNRQRQALISAYSATNVTVTGQQTQPHSHTATHALAHTRVSRVPTFCLVPASLCQYKHTFGHHVFVMLSCHSISLSARRRERLWLAPLNFPRDNLSTQFL
jgi:hypothetical protein